MKAEEFFKWKWSTLWNSTKHREDTVKMMEAYHQSRVNAISDLFYDLKAYFEANNEGNATNEFLNRIKEQLLKQ